MAEALLEVRGLAVDYGVQRSAWARPQILHALRGVSFRLAQGETLGIVGESGCGKSTLARALVGLVATSDGTIHWRGRAVLELDRPQRLALRREMQIVFQDPVASLDPRMRIEAIIAEPLGVFERGRSAQENRARVRRMLERVGLAAVYAGRFPHQLSGGQCQRVAIARALILQPRLLICDEPVSSLDVSVQAQIVNLLKSLQRDLGLSMIFISHNMAVVRQVSARVLVMYLGRVMELGARDSIFRNPRHPYTRGLLAAVQPFIPHGGSAQCARSLGGEVPSALDPPAGCVFHTRCAWVGAQCRQLIPPLEDSGGHCVACLRWRELPGS